MNAPQTTEQPDKDLGLGQALDFMRLLWALDHRLQSTSKRMLTEVGVTGLQRMAIRFIGRFEDISAGQLATLLHVHPSTLTGVLDKLVRARMVKRTPDPADARRARLSVTPKGRAIDRLRKGTVEAAVRRALDRSTPAEVEAAVLVLNRVAEELDPE